jgi:hypothetical protein
MQSAAYRLALPRSCRSWLRAAALCLLQACSFGSDEDAMEMNTCSVDADCSTQHCESGRCVAEVENTLPVTVVVTPKRTPNGAPALPITSESFDLNGGPQTISLRLPVSVPVRVLNKGKAIAAQASFTPVDTKNRFTAKTTRLTLLAAGDEGPLPANNAMLLDGMSYRVLVQPSDLAIAPHSLLFTAEADASIEVDYATLKNKTKKFLVHNAARVAYQVRAIAEGTGAPISDTVSFTGSLTGLSSIELSFDDADAAYKLEFTPVAKQSYSTGSDGSCGDDTPQPRLTVPSRLFTPDLTTVDKWYVELPQLHPAVEYSGVIGLCSSQKPSGDLQVQLKTDALYLASGDSEAVQGAFETAAAASWDSDENKYRFCARVPPGSYTVVVTPSPNLSCEIFAEKRLLRPDWPGQPDELNLRMPALLTANVLTPDRMPMPGATVNVLALASTDLARTPEDRSVANYNRSSSVATGTDGSFTLSVDRGRYDVFIKPPEASNYAWRVIYDVAIAKTEAEFATEIMLSEPVAVGGKLQYINGSTADQQSLADADVRAYTLVNLDGQGSEQRTVEIGSGHADAAGNVTLLLPPALQRSWNP